MKIAIIGTGAVGRTIASKLVELKYDVIIGTRNVSDKLASTAKDFYGNPPFSEWLKSNKKVGLESFCRSCIFWRDCDKCHKRRQFGNSIDTGRFQKPVRKDPH